MAKQFSDFAQLKGLKKSLGSQNVPSQAKTSPQPQKRSRVVIHPTIHEEHARNEGYVKGQKVRMMDTNDEVVITGVHKGCFELSYPDGLTFTATKSEFILVNRDEDRAMYRSMPSASAKRVEKKPAPGSGNDTITVDLHLERIPGSESIPGWAALDFQIDYFKRIIRENSRHKGKKIVFIHGFGDGTLKEALLRELDQTFALSCSYCMGTADNHGPGTVIVTIR